jgi:hypothetical protein
LPCVLTDSQAPPAFCDAAKWSAIEKPPAKTAAELVFMDAHRTFHS